MKQPKAGEAFAAELASDPKTQAAWKRTQMRLRAFGVGADAVEVCSPTATLLAISRITSAQWEAATNEARSELAETLREVAVELEANREKWEAKYGEPYPQEVDDWIEHAVRAGVDPNKVCDIDWGVLVRSVQGYLRRVKDWHTDAPITGARGAPTEAESYAYRLYEYGVNLWKSLPGNRDKKPTSKDVHEALKREHDAEYVSPNAHSVFNPKYGLPKRETLRANASRYRTKKNLAPLNES